MIRSILPISAAILLASCSSLPVPGPATTGAATESARQIMKQSAASHGDAWEKYRKVEVEYTGEWSPIAKRLQPVLTDPAFRGSSVETYQPATGKVRQMPLLAKAHQWRMTSLKLDGAHVKWSCAFK